MTAVAGIHSKHDRVRWTNRGAVRTGVVLAVLHGYFLKGCADADTTVGT